MSRATAAVIESLEGRALLSAVPGTVQPTIKVLTTAATTTSTVSGYTPAEIRKAYGFDTVAATGSGQTIAIVDAYNDPNVRADLATFDAEFGLSAAPSFDVVNQTGGTSLPTTDADWAGEIALDVEWAHAAAPGANLLLVETASDDTDDLIAGVNYARHASGVSVVSMSWGGSEFFSFGGGGESSSQTAYDTYFTTPSGHQGVTFVAAAGDSGTSSGIEWPASSPNVLSVGGTTLTTDSDGTYEGEAGWSGTSGGVSQVEVEPTYQDAVQSTGYRSGPDVSYDGDPNTGVAVYDSVADDGVSGWQEVGGTSAGAPQWAGLIAVADQGRKANGLTTLDGATQTLPDLYAVYGSPGTTAYDTYSDDFYDITSGGSSDTTFRGGRHGSNGTDATAGYDTVTGLGSPHAASIITLLAGATTTSGSTGGSTTTGSGSGGTTTTANLPASTITGTFLTSPTASVVGGAAGVLKLKLTNTADSTFSGPVTVTLYTSTDTALSSEDASFSTLTLTRVSLRAGGSKTVALKYDYPTTLTSGSYYVIGAIDATSTDTEPATAVAASAVAIAAPMVDLSTTFANTTAISVREGKNGVATIRITNLGNVTAAGTFDLTLYASATGLLDTSVDPALATLTNRKIKLRAGKTMTLRVPFQALSDAAGGTYSLIATVASTTSVADTNTGNDTATLATQAA